VTDLAVTKQLPIRIENSDKDCNFSSGKFIQAYLNKFFDDYILDLGAIFPRFGL